MNLALRSVEELLSNRSPERRVIPDVPKEITSALWDRIFEGAQILRRLPDRERVWLTSGDRAAWPPIILNYWEAYNQHRARYRPPAPSSRQLTEMEETFQWLTWVSRPKSYGGLGDKKTMDAVFVCCGENRAPSEAAHILGLHRNTVRRYRDEGLCLIAKKFMLKKAA